MAECAIQVMAESTGERYTYDGTGLMQTRTVDGVTTQFIWDGANIVAEITDNVVTTYSRGIRLISTKIGTTKYYYHHIKKISIKRMQKNDDLLYAEYSDFYRSDGLVELTFSKRDCKFKTNVLE